MKKTDPKLIAILISTFSMTSCLDSGYMAPTSGASGFSRQPVNPFGPTPFVPALGANGNLRFPSSGLHGFGLPNPSFGGGKTAAMVSLASLLAQGIYEASVQQQQHARAHANSALAQNKSIMKSVSTGEARYVVTPGRVTNTSTGQTAPALMKMKVSRSSDGRLQAGKPVPIEATAGKNGQIINAAGDSAVYLAP